MSDLIQRLNQLVGLTPDQIAAAVCDPFSQWRLCSSLTEAEYAQFPETQIVILYHDYATQPELCEKHHRIASNTEGCYPWEYSRFAVLGYFSFRSKFSWEMNPTEGLPSCQRNSSRF